MKDTVSVPSKGFIAVRFRANNPGFWMIHCHYGKFFVRHEVDHSQTFNAEYHMTNGMAVVLQVGKLSQMVSPPPKFPKCGDFAPEVNFDG